MTRRRFPPPWSVDDIDLLAKAGSRYGSQSMAAALACYPNLPGSQKANHLRCHLDEDDDGNIGRNLLEIIESLRPVGNREPR